MSAKRALLLLFAAAARLLAADGAAEPERVNEQALAAHRVRHLGEASRHYDRLLALDPPPATTAAHRALALRHVPRLHLVAGEFFPLKDIVAVLHPERPVIGYHLFWEDDLGFPADNEPCDHEIVWVEYDPATGRVVRVQAYFHGRLVEAAEAAADANAHGGRPWIGVEWGFHGSVPRGGLEAAAPTLRPHWERVQRGMETPHPLARGWPQRFDGGYEAYVAFSVPYDPAPQLEKSDLIVVSRWANAVLNRRGLRYNFSPKAEWPWLIGAPP